MLGSKHPMQHRAISALGLIRLKGTVSFGFGIKEDNGVNKHEVNTLLKAAIINIFVSVTSHFGSM